jgi:hypothetical protein
VVLFFEKGKPTKHIWYYQLDPGRSLGKTSPLNDDDLAEFVALQPNKADIGNGNLDLRDVNLVSEETYRAWTRRAIPEPGDLIMAREAPAGNVAVIPDGEMVCLGQRTLLIKLVRGSTDPGFLAYLLLHPAIQKRLLSKSSGATVEHVNMRDIRALLLPDLPDLLEQMEYAQKIRKNAGPIINERNTYGAGRHRWHPGLAALAEEYGFRPKVCQPYRAQTKGKVERFNGYLKGSFITPLAATLKVAGLALDVEAANAHIGPWLEEIAHQRIHGTTGVKPAVRLAEERRVLQPLPADKVASAPAPRLRAGQTLPHESFQHPLSVYEQLLEVSA